MTSLGVLIFKDKKFQMLICVKHFGTTNEQREIASMTTCAIKRKQ